MTLGNIQAGELGLSVAEVIREAMASAVAGANVATYIEDESPVGWDKLSEAGWDLVGIQDDEDSASLRDLVEIAVTWGNSLIQLPLLPSLIAKRHAPQAAEWDGPVSFSISTQTSKPGTGYVPFGQLEGMAVLDALGGDGALVPIEAPEAYDYAPSLRLATIPMISQITGQAAYELRTIWAAEAAGVTKRLLSDAAEFAKQREQFNRPIGSFQAVKHHLANAHIAAELAETAAIWASLDQAKSDLAIRESFEQSLKSIHLSTQVFGGIGFTWEMGVHFSLRHVTMLRELVNALA